MILILLKSGREGLVREGISRARLFTDWLRGWSCDLLISLWFSLLPSVKNKVRSIILPIDSRLEFLRNPLLGTSISGIDILC